MKMVKLISLMMAVAVPSFLQANQTNVLLITVDDLNDMVSWMSDEPGNLLTHVYPDKALRDDVVGRLTPNMERLAQKSTKFMAAYCPEPLCLPSRQAILTGYRPMTTNLSTVPAENWKYFRLKPGFEDTLTLPQYLEQKGYQSIGVGKIYHSAKAGSIDYPDTGPSWTQWIHRPVGTDSPASFPSYSVPVDNIYKVPIGETLTSIELTADYENANAIASLMENDLSDIVLDTRYNNNRRYTLDPNKPFFLACGIFRPHTALYATAGLFDLFPISEMSVDRNLLETFQNDRDDLPPQGLHRVNRPPQDFSEILSHGLTVDPLNGDVEGWKHYIQAYLACVAYADKCVGRLLDGLENSPYANNTMVVLWSDHGYHIGEKNHFQKQTLWERAIKVPFLISMPGQTESAECRSPVSLMDFYPTICSQLGFETPEHVEGRDLSLLLDFPDLPWTFPVLIQNDRHLAIRSGDWKYIRYIDGNTELYNLVDDPNEFNNLSLDSQYSATLSSLSLTLDTEVQRTFNNSPLENKCDVFVGNTEATEIRFHSEEGANYWIQEKINGGDWETISEPLAGDNEEITFQATQSTEWRIITDKK